MLRLEAISKHFSGTQALKNLTLEIRGGETVGLIGENGAGKSTVIKIIAGVHRPDSGRMLLAGDEARFADPRAGLEAGIATIHQELACFERLTVAENLMLGERWPRRWGGTDWRALQGEARRRLADFGLEIAPERMFHTLSPAQRQEVAIARALARSARLLVLDEPTASLTEPEVERLFEHLRRLKAKGLAILYVSHRLDEIQALADRVAVLRDGALVAEYPAGEASIERMVRDMVGRELAAAAPRPAREPGETILEARGLSRAGLFEDISFCLRRGEILGLGGLVGAGRSEVARAIFGLYAAEGAMFLEGRPWRPGSAAEARASGVAYVPEERKRQGFVLEHTIASSISIGFLERVARMGMISRKAEREAVRSAIGRFGVKAAHPELAVGSLSGGNQQKALLARWLEGGPRVIVLDEPTRGVDVGAKAEIHRLVRDLAEKGRAVLLISSDLPELLGLSDRVLVLHRGRVAAEFAAGEATQEKVLLAASGLRAGSGES